MKKMLFLLTVLLSLGITGCTQPVLDVSGITNEVTGVVSEMTITVPNKTIEEGKNILLNYDGVNIAECGISLISEWGEPILLSNSNISSASSTQCNIENGLKPGKYYLTLTTSKEKTNTVEIDIVAAGKTPHISKIIEGSNSVKIYGNNFIKSYAPVVVCDGKNAEVMSFTATCVEIKKISAGKHTIQVVSGEVKSNTEVVTTK